VLNFAPFQCSRSKAYINRRWKRCAAPCNVAYGPGTIRPCLHNAFLDTHTSPSVRRCQQHQICYKQQYNNRYTSTAQLCGRTDVEEECAVQQHGSSSSDRHMASLRDRVRRQTGSTVSSLTRALSCSMQSITCRYAYIGGTRRRFKKDLKKRGARPVEEYSEGAEGLKTLDLAEGSGTAVKQGDLVTVRCRLHCGFDKCQHLC